MAQRVQAERMQQELFSNFAEGVATVLHSFVKNTEGGMPKGSLVLASDSNFYGMTTTGGPKAYGTIFKITPNGTFSVLYNFNPAT
jgi:uncharacterized repeat protein (TIGR03803 family)